MPRFHVSADGNPRPCNAQAGACPLSEEDGSETPHGEFANAAAAMAFAEAVNEKRFGGSFAPVQAGPDRSKLKPAFADPVYPETKPLEGGMLDQGLSCDSDDFEDYGDSYQEFRDAAGDRDGYQLELATVTQVFSDSGEALSTSFNYQRAIYDDAEDRTGATNELLTDSDANELADGREIVREEWSTPNTRVTYRVRTYDMM